MRGRVCTVRNGCKRHVSKALFLVIAALVFALANVSVALAMPYIAPTSIAPSLGTTVTVTKPTLRFYTAETQHRAGDFRVIVRTRVNSSGTYSTVMDSVVHQGWVSWKPAEDLPLTSTVDVHVTVQNTVGYVETINSYWSFKIAATQGRTEECIDCHEGFPAAHPLSNCSACHGASSQGDDYHWNPGATAPAGNCLNSCHEEWQGGSSYQHGIDLDDIGDHYYTVNYAPKSPLEAYQFETSWVSGRTYSCESCHSSAFPSVPTCGRPSLTDDHLKWQEAFCMSCHEQNKPTEQKAVTACKTCH